MVMKTLPKKANANARNNGVNYENFVKKQQENISKVGVEKQLSTISPKKNLPMNGGTGGQDPNISMKSEASLSTKTGGEDYLNDNVIEDVRVGNMLLNQIKISEWISNYFAMTTLGAGIIEYELATSFEPSDVIDDIRISLLWT